jgi:hypothetical protein
MIQLLYLNLYNCVINIQLLLLQKNLFPFMPKRAKKEDLNRFRQDFAKLKEKYSNDEIARKLEINSANLSNYGSGGKNPGEIFLKKFYMQFGEETKQPSGESPNSGDQTPPKDYKNDQVEYKVEEAPVLYMRLNKSLNEVSDLKSEYIKTLKEDHGYLWSNFGKIVDANQSLANSQDKMAQSNLILAETTRALVNGDNQVKG